MARGRLSPAALLSWEASLVGCGCAVRQARGRGPGHARVAPICPSPGLGDRRIAAGRCHRDIYGHSHVSAQGVVGATRPPFDPGSVTTVTVLRGGALEPGAGNVTCESAGNRELSGRGLNGYGIPGPFSLGRGLSCQVVLTKLYITSHLIRLNFWAKRRAVHGPPSLPGAMQTLIQRMRLRARARGSPPAAGVPRPARHAEAVTIMVASVEGCE